MTVMWSIGMGIWVAAWPIGWLVARKGEPPDGFLKGMAVAFPIMFVGLCLQWGAILAK